MSDQFRKTIRKVLIISFTLAAILFFFFPIEKTRSVVPCQIPPCEEQVNILTPYKLFFE